MGCCQSNTTATVPSVDVSGVHAVAVAAQVPAQTLVEATTEEKSRDFVKEKEDEEQTDEEKAIEKKALHQLKIVFNSIDTGKNGSVSKLELSAALKDDHTLAALVKEAGLNDVFFVLNQLDTDGNHRVSWSEFQKHLLQAAVQEVKNDGHIAAAERPAKEKALEKLKAIFVSLDANSDGAVNKEELSAKLSCDDCKEDELTKLIKHAGLNPDYSLLEALDTNKDGQVTWEEFESHLYKASIEVVLEEMVVETHCCGCCLGPL